MVWVAYACSIQGNFVFRKWLKHKLLIWSRHDCTFCWSSQTFGLRMQKGIYKSSFSKWTHYDIPIPCAQACDPNICSLSNDALTLLFIVVSLPMFQWNQTMLDSSVTCHTQNNQWTKILVDLKENVYVHFSVSCGREFRGQIPYPNSQVCHC